MSKPKSKAGQKFLAELSELENIGIAFHSEPKDNILAIEDEIDKASAHKLLLVCMALEALARRYHGVDRECRYGEGRPLDPNRSSFQIYDWAVCPNPMCAMARLALESVDE